MMRMQRRSRRIRRGAWGLEALEGRQLMTAGLQAQFAPGWSDAVDVRFERIVSDFQESAGVVPITITRGGDLSLGASARVRTVTIDALEGYDYYGLDQGVTFAPGSATATFNLTILDDAIAEPETKALYLQVYQPSDVVSTETIASMMVVIHDDEAASRTPLTLHAFGDAGLWTHNEVEGYRKINDASPEAIYSAPNRGAYLDFGPAGLWSWDALRGYERLNAVDPQAILTSDRGESLLIDFGHGGLWNWSRADGYSRVTDVDPRAMAGTAERAMVDFGPAGLWTFDGTHWLKLDDQSPEAIVADGEGGFFVDYGPRGLWQTRTSILNAYTLDGCVPVSHTSLEQINPADPVSITPTSYGAFIGFGAAGLWRYDGGWEKINDLTPRAITVGAGSLYMNYGDAGLWRWAFNGEWSKLHDVAPTSALRITTIDPGLSSLDVLDLDYGNAGLWRWTFTTGEWTRLSPARLTAFGLTRMDTGVVYGIPV